MDPTFDEPGKHDYLTKTVGPAVPAAALGSIDVVLVSHDQHPDNFDNEGRQVALAAPLVLTHPGGADRLGPPAVGLKPFESFELPAVDGTKAVTVQAVPAVHGPADGQRDAGGHVNCEVTGFVLSGPGLPTVYLSGDNASISAVKDIADRVGAVDVAIIFAGAARVPAKERGRPLTMTGNGPRRPPKYWAPGWSSPPTSTAGRTSAKESANSAAPSTSPESSTYSRSLPTASGSFRRGCSFQELLLGCDEISSRLTLARGSASDQHASVDLDCQNTHRLRQVR